MDSIQWGVHTRHEQLVCKAKHSQPFQKTLGLLSSFLKSNVQNYCSCFQDDCIHLSASHVILSARNWNLWGRGEQQQYMEGNKY